MECRECAELLAAYASDDLSSQERAEMESHLRECEACRCEYESYRAVITLMGDDPILSPTREESAALAQVLSRIPLSQPVVRRETAQPAGGLLGFALASVAVFAFLVIVLGMQLLGRINLMWAIRSIDPVKIVLAGIVVVVVTSFIPIWMTARRRPLNGLTFSR